MVRFGILNVIVIVTIVINLMRIVNGSLEGSGYCELSVSVLLSEWLSQQMLL